MFDCVSFLFLGEVGAASIAAESRAEQHSKQVSSQRFDSTAKIDERSAHIDRTSD